MRSARPCGATCERLLRHADGLPAAEAAAPAVAAIRDGRQLLDEPDPIAPLLTELAHRPARRGDPAGTAARRRPARRGRRARRHGQSGTSSTPPTLTPSSPTPSSSRDPPPDVSTESDAARIARRRPPQPRGPTGSRLVDSRRDQARQRAAKKLEPKSVEVKPPSATFKPGDDPTPYFDQLRALVQSHLDAGATVII